MPGEPRAAHRVPTGGGEDHRVLRARRGQALTLVATKPADPDGPVCPHCAVIYLVESEPPGSLDPQTRPAVG